MSGTSDNPENRDNQERTNDDPEGLSIPLPENNAQSSPTTRERPRLRISTTTSSNHVVQIVDDSTDSNKDIWDEKMDILNVRRPSNVEEDVCYPMNTSSAPEGIDYNALEGFMREDEEEDTDMRRVLSPLSITPVNITPARSFTSSAQNLNRKFSLYGERSKMPEEDLTDKYRFTFYSIATGSIRAKTLFEISRDGVGLMELLKKGSFWIDILAPTDSEMKMLSKIFNIHPLTMEDISEEETREKCEIFKNYYFVCFRSFNQDHNSANYLQPLSTYSVVLREGILTFHFKPAPHPHKVRNRINQLKDFITVTPDWINYALIDDITDSFAPLIHKVEFETDAVDELVLILKESDQPDMLRRIGRCRKMVMLLLRLLGTKADVVKALRRCEEDKHHNTEMCLYLGDIQDHIITMLQNLTHCEKTLRQSHSNYLAQISIEITQLSNATNSAVGKLSVFATILVPMNIVTGLWGMNVKVPGRDQDDYIWFFWIVGCMFIFGTIFAMAAKQHGII